MKHDEAAVGRADFMASHGLWDDAQRDAAQDALARIEAEKLDFVRLCFVDPHGLVRAKTMAAGEIASVFRNGCAFPSSLILKDTSQRSVTPVFSGSSGFGVAGLGGVGDLMMAPDPQTFRVLPWAPNTGWILCDIHLTSGEPLPFSTRRLYRKAVDDLAEAGFDFVAGLEVEFYVFKRDEERLDPARSPQPPEPPKVSLLAQGYQYLNETHGDQLDLVTQKLASVCRALDLPLRSFETEFGPSQFEATFNPASGMRVADNMILFRTAVKQVCHRLGLHATFMCRPALPNLLSSGWHLHQSWRAIKTGRNAFAPDEAGAPLSPLGTKVLAGLLDTARATCVFSTPTINGYKRYRPLSLAPDRAVWGRDNKGAMIRVVNAGPRDPGTRLENRVGEPAANPYLYMASQIVSGLHGVRRKLQPATASDTPYETQAPLLPKSLVEALDALRGSDVYRDCFGAATIDYLLAIKDAEVARFLSEVTDWEQREYFSIF